MTSTDARWHFIEQRPADKQRDPLQGQFFDTESIKNAADALVREAIQNSLDAHDPGDGNQPVRVNLLVSEGDHALPAEVAGPYFSGMWDHLAAIPVEDDQLSPDERQEEFRKIREAPCRYLVFEDFNTTGLRGDPEAIQAIPGDPNHFFYFWRAEGQSGKTGSDRGRWGVGKYVFPAASMISTIFGFTIRPSDPKPLLMGQAVLRNHQLGDKSYTPDAWWAKMTDRELPVPVPPGSTITDFVGTWRLTRKPGQAGLSIVVPYINDEITIGELKRSVIRDYFAVIVAGRLVVGLSDGDPDRTMQIDADSISHFAAELEDETEKRDALSGIELVQWNTTEDTEGLVELVLPEHNAQGGRWTPHWSYDLMPDESRERILARFADGQPVCVRVPVLIGAKRTTAEASHFDVLIRPEKANTSGPLFVREGIVISEARVRPPGGASIRDYRCILLADDPPLARMLGDAEGPAHTTWSDRTPRFKGRYWLGKSWLDFVKTSPWRILQLTESSEEDEDLTLAADIFFIDIEDPAQSRREPKPGTAGKQDGPPPSTPRQFKVSRVTTGFAVSLGNANGSSPERALVRVAYDVADGNPFRKWVKADFSLQAPDIQLSLEGGSVVSDTAHPGNEIAIRIDDPASFRFEARGFDEERDLIISVDPIDEEADQ